MIEVLDCALFIMLSFFNFQRDKFDRSMGFVNHDLHEAFGELKVLVLGETKMILFIVFR